MQRRHLLQTGAALATSVWAAARADSKPLTLLVGYNPGGPVDIVARQLAEHLREPLGRQVMVDYKPGAGGQFALTALKQAPADGALLALSPPSPLTIFPSTFAKLAYDPFKDFAPIATACTFDFAFTVAAGQLASALSPQANFAELVKGGRLRLLGTTGAARSLVFPQVPTFTEAGFPAMQSEEWFALFARAGTPQPLLDALADAMRQVVAREDVRKALGEMGFNPEARNAARLVQDIRADFERWAEVVRRTGFKADA